MFNIIYNILLYLYFLITLPFYVIKLFTSEKYRTGLKQRFGFVPVNRSEKTILLHAVSVGEILAAVPLVNALKKEYEDYKLVITTTTLTGNRVAKKQIGGTAVTTFFPIDFTWAVNGFLDRINPGIIILVETELWPNFLRISKKRGIPVVVVNARISEHSFRNYYRFRNIFKKAVEDIKYFSVQSGGDMMKLLTLGINPSRIMLSGNLKIDSALDRRPDIDKIDDIKKNWGWGDNILVLTGGSTHRGEEKILLDLYKELKREFNNLVLILAPRHPERKDEIKNLISGYGFKTCLRSEWNTGKKISTDEVILIDTLGELINIYALSDIIFIGKSMIKGGGQNLLEPACMGKPVICGPKMGNFRELTLWLKENGGIIQVGNEAELKYAIRKLLYDSNERIELGIRAKKLIERGKGAVERNMCLIKGIKIAAD